MHRIPRQARAALKDPKGKAKEKENPRTKAKEKEVPKEKAKEKEKVKAQKTRANRKSR